MKIGVFIPGRLDSERLPNKLILPLGQSCLWDMACQKLNALPDKYDKYALCNDKELVSIALKYPNIRVILREEATCKVDGPLNYIFKDLKYLPNNVTHLMFLNPCLSFLSVKTIVDALEYFEKWEADYATSVKKLQNWVFSSNMQDPINYIDYERLTTKEIEPMWQAAHCFHIFNKDSFFEDGMMLKPGHLLIPVPEEETIDVDSYEDYQYAKWKHSKKYVIDIDGVICTTNGIDYEKAEPIIKNIEKFNKLYDAGNTIWYQTARGYVSGIDYRELTENQLKKWGVKYDALLFGKPDADYYIDDKAINSSDFLRGLG
jgi:CMP-N-acetylneuraminic acid synthetase